MDAQKKKAHRHRFKVVRQRAEPVLCAYGIDCHQTLSCTVKGCKKTAKRIICD